MHKINIDVETFSSVSLPDCGVYEYVQAKDFEILLFGYSIDDGPEQIVDISNWQRIPGEIIKGLTNPLVIKKAWNCAFEMATIGKHFKLNLDPAQWECTMSKAAIYGFPLKLDVTARVLQTGQEKDKVGKALIKLFCEPQTNIKRKRDRFRPEDAPEKWAQFKEYCLQDIRTEKAIEAALSGYPFPEQEKIVWNLDQKINARGILVDRPYIQNAISIDGIYQAQMTAKAVELTGLENPNSVAQLKKWLSNESGKVVASLAKDRITDLIDTGGQSDIALEVLRIRQKMSKSSVGKYYTMLDYSQTDGRIRGQFQYYGAGTGRWAGRGPQPHNLPKTYSKSLGWARKMIAGHRMDMIETIYGNIPATLSELIRPAYIAKPGYKFIIGDFSQIEARVISWIAGEKWRMDVFEKDEIDIYVASGSAMFKLPIDQCGKGTKVREKAKISELALGYQGGVGALAKMGGEKMGLSRDEMQELVWAWRRANKQIVKLWYDADEAARMVVSGAAKTADVRGLTFFMKGKILFMRLHSGRCLAYPFPRIYMSKITDREGKVYEKEAVGYEGMTESNKVWGLVGMYGGKWIENAVQAEARDLLAEALIRIEAAGYPVVGHVHDETITEVLKYINCLDHIDKLMTVVPEWAKGLPMKADCFESDYYKKDG